GNPCATAKGCGGGKALSRSDSAETRLCGDLCQSRFHGTGDRPAASRHGALSRGGPTAAKWAGGAFQPAGRVGVGASARRCDQAISGGGVHEPDILAGALFIGGGTGDGGAVEGSGGAVRAGRQIT